MNKKKKKKNNKKKKQFFLSGMENDSQFSLFEVIVMILISVIFGVIIGYLITYGNSNLSRVRSNTNLGEIVSAYNNIVDNYYEEVDESQLAESAIKGMVSSLEDPYSSFLDPDSTSSFNESVDGEYVGIGITVEFDGEYNRVISVLENGPAKKAGVQINDLVISIDGHSCKGIYSGELQKLVEGDVGSSLELVVQRGEEELTLSVERQKIEAETVLGQIIEEDDHKIGYIRISIFTSHFYTQFEKVLKRLEKEGMDSLILDIRNNPGGHLVQAKNILSRFFPKKTVLYQIESNGVRKKVYSLNNQTLDYPMVVLINGETASSAEVVAACFQDHKKATIVGTNSYGKGNVQKTVSFSNGSSMKFTIEKWLSPKGKSVTGVGVVPDVVVEQSPEFYVEPNAFDTQFEEAKRILIKES